MSKFTKTILASTIFAASMMSANAAHAATATAEAKANILTSVAVTNSFPLDFGTIAAGSTASSVTVSATETATVSCVGTLLCPTAVTSAVFGVTGTTGQAVAITVPSSVTLTGTGGSMTATLVSSDSLITLGTKNGFVVGGTLSVGANQTSGLYSGTFDVTVAYQ